MPSSSKKANTLWDVKTFICKICFLFFGPHLQNGLAHLQNGLAHLQNGLAHDNISKLDSLPLFRKKIKKFIFMFYDTEQYF